MNAVEAVFAALLLGMPIWFVARAWHIYLGLSANSRGRLLQLRMGLMLISVSAGIWIAVFALLFSEDYSIDAASLTRNVPIGILGLIDILLCIAAFGCSEVWRSVDKESIRLRRAIGFSSGVLVLVWLFVLTNPH